MCFCWLHLTCFLYELDISVTALMAAFNLKRHGWLWGRWRKHVGGWTRWRRCMLYSLIFCAISGSDRTPYKGLIAEICIELKNWIVFKVSLNTKTEVQTNGDFSLMLPICTLKSLWFYCFFPFYILFNIFCRLMFKNEVIDRYMHCITVYADF